MIRTEIHDQKRLLFFLLEIETYHFHTFLEMEVFSFCLFLNSSGDWMEVESQLYCKALVRGGLWESPQDLSVPRSPSSCRFSSPSKLSFSLNISSYSRISTRSSSFRVLRGDAFSNGPEGVFQKVTGGRNQKLLFRMFWTNRKEGRERLLLSLISISSRRMLRKWRRLFSSRLFHFYIVAVTGKRLIDPSRNHLGVSGKILPRFSLTLSRVTDFHISKLVVPSKTLPWRQGCWLLHWLS